MLDTNQKTYVDRRIVQYYTQLKLLQPAERTILNQLRNQLAHMKMLDIGVGGGRTTQHFSKAVSSYAGIDYSDRMIAACQERFQSSDSLKFSLCDARDMNQFEDDSFNFILFSFNGIDYVSHGDRLKIFQEVGRVGKSGGYFCFSSHNLQGIEKELNWRKQVSFNPLKTYVNLIMLVLFRLFNFPQTLRRIRTSNHVILKDESHNFRLNTYYIRPEAQIRQLESRFSNIRVYSWRTGLELDPETELNVNTDQWLYYLCEIK